MAAQDQFPSLGDTAFVAAADSDDFGQSFRAEVGHLFRLMPAGHSD
jgi:hypothetical protein